MHNLIEKYRNNKLSSEEIKELRALLDSMPDSQLGKALGNDWEGASQELSGAEVPETVVDRIEQCIDRDISRKRVAVSVFLNVAACCVVAAVGVAVGYFWQSGANEPVSSGMLIASDENDRTEMTFPDKSQILMNPNSRVDYDAVPSLSGERRIRFDGIGHFMIARDPDRPFVVSTDMLDVTVFGTEFYLSAEADSESASLYLQDGKVEFLSKKTDKRIDMKPGDTAVLDYATGDISVSADTALVTVFRLSDKSLLNYDNVQLGSVVASLNTCYAPFRILLDSDRLSKLEFTGSLPRNNLMGALSVLEYTANLKISISNSEITLYR